MPLNPDFDIYQSISKPYYLALYGPEKCDRQVHVRRLTLEQDLAINAAVWNCYHNTLQYISYMTHNWHDIIWRNWR